MTQTTQTTQLRDFSRKRLPVRFTIDDDTFSCHKALPLVKLQQVIRDFGTGVEVEDVSNVVDKISSIMRIFMKQESYTRFMARFNPTDEMLESDDFEPIDQNQLVDIVRWLIEVYTGRPTEPSPNSSSGSSDGTTGTSSTDGALLAESDLLS